MTAVQLPVMIDGTLRTPETAVVPVGDEGVLRGDGAFEVLRLYGGRPFGLDEHLDRMEQTCRMIELAFPRETMEQEILATLREAGPLDANLRFAITRGGCRIVLVEPLPDWKPITLGVVAYTPTGVLDGTKTLSYAANMLASRWAKARGHDEALLVHPGGWLLEGPISSIFLVRDGAIATPPVDAGILASITRQLVLHVADVEVRRVAEAELHACDEAFMVSSSREVQPIRGIEGRELPVDGPVTTAVAAAYGRLVAERLGAVEALG